MSLHTSCKTHPTSFRSSPGEEPGAETVGQTSTKPRPRKKAVTSPGSQKPVWAATSIFLPPVGPPKGLSVEPKPQNQGKRSWLLAVACPKDTDSILGQNIHSEDSMLPGLEGSSVWSPSVDAIVTHGLRLLHFKVSKEFLLPKNLSTCFGSQTPFLGESSDVIPVVPLHEAPCLDPTRCCLLPYWVQTFG